METNISMSKGSVTVRANAGEKKRLEKCWEQNCNITNVQSYVKLGKEIIPKNNKLVTEKKREHK